jgi:hypothetical protein
MEYISVPPDNPINDNTKKTPPEKIEQLKRLIHQASIRIDSFWGRQASNPKFIYCDAQEDFANYSANPSAPAVTYLKFGSVIVLSADAVDLDILAHEVSHAELYQRIGFYRFNYKIPSWFKHGLAMQNDYRSYYSDDTLEAKTDNFKNLPDVKGLASDKEFYSGSQDQIMLHYMVAKHELRKWYTRAKLDKFLTDLNSGKSFEEAFGH